MTGIQVPLFDVPARQMVHLWRHGLCVVCKASKGSVEQWPDCGARSCPGWVNPAPRGMTLGDALAMHEPAEAVPLEEAA